MKIHTHTHTCILIIPLCLHMTTETLFFLLPELWNKIRPLLVTEYDARDCVALQRTCKTMYKMDSGLILPLAWARIWNTSTTYFGGITYLRRAAHILQCITDITASGLMDKPYFFPPYELDMSGEIDMFSGMGTHWRLIMAWKLGEDCTAKLVYQYSHNLLSIGKSPIMWQLEIGVGAYLRNTSLTVSASSLSGLFAKCPTLCFGISTECMLARKDDLEGLFVHKNHRVT